LCLSGYKIRFWKQKGDETKMVTRIGLQLQTNPDDEYDIDSMIEQLAKDGFICDKYGHMWDKEPVPMHWQDSMNPPDGYRTCKLCGKIQIGYEHEIKWVDVDV